MALDVEVRSGRARRLENSWRVQDRLEARQRPRLASGGGHGDPPFSRGIGFGGDAGFLSERMTSECESGERDYLFRQLQGKAAGLTVRQILEKFGRIQFM